MSTDPIADLLTRIRNAHQSKHDRVDVPASKMKLGVCRLLEQEGFVGDVEVLDGELNDTLRISLNYTAHGEPAIQHLKRISRGGRRVYRGGAWKFNAATARSAKLSWRKPSVAANFMGLRVVLVPGK